MPDCKKSTDVLGTARGYCSKHYSRLIRNGDPAIRSTKKYLTKQKCSADDCLELVVGKGLCDKHWMRNKRHGDPNSHARPYWTDKELRHLYDILDRTPDGLGHAVDKELVHLSYIIDRSVAAICCKLHKLRMKRKRAANYAITNGHA